MNDDTLKAILKFRDERDWKQFHTPKNLSMSIAIEAAELMEVFQWMGAADRLSAMDRLHAEEEIADVAIYLSLLAHDLDIDLERVVLSKIDKNATKYPVEEFKGAYRRRT